MSGLSGIEILELIEKDKIHIHIIIITAYEELVLQAARFGFIDYIRKPFDIDQLRESIEKYKIHWQQHKTANSIDKFLNHFSKKIRIPISFEDIFFDPEEIIFLEAAGAYTNIYLLNNKKIISSFHLKRIYELLPVDTFIRISRKHIINYKYLFKIDKKSRCCILNHQINLTELPYSKGIIRQSGLLQE